MAKSSYLDNLINNRLPVVNDRYLSNLWNSYNTNTYYTYFNSMINNFTNEQLVAITSDEYINNLSGNQTVLNMNDPQLAAITLNPQYLPIKKTHGNSDGYNKYTQFNTRVDKYGNLQLAPPEYLPATITSNKGGVKRTIPILFPSTFSRSISASFAKENPVGSDRPIMAYSYTDAEEIPFEFDALVDYLPAGYTTLSSYVDDIISILKPGKGANNIIYEPTVEVEFADIYFKGICSSVSISYDNVYNNRSFVHAKINCQFTRLG